MMTSLGKTCGLKFQLTSREVLQPNGGIRNVPCYSLTKTECLYVATKFNDEVRAQKFSTSSRDFWRRLSKMETSFLLRSTCAKIPFS